MRVLFSAVFLLGVAQVGSAGPLTGEAIVTGLRALAESGGTITSGAGLSKALGNPAASALFPTVSQLFASAKGQSLKGLDWDALAAQAKTMSPQAAASRISSVLKSGQAINQQTMMAAFSVPAARTAAVAEFNAANGAANFNSIVCPTGATQCTKLVSAIESARKGQNNEMPISEAEQSAALMGGIFALIDANKANCGSDEQCVVSLKDGFAGVIGAFGSRTNREFAKVVIESGKTEKSDFTPFRGKNGQIARGVRNAGALGAQMGSALEQCFVAGG